jgi:predicted PurR-regulated permease PerM
VSLLLWSAVLGGMGTLLALPLTLLVKSLVIDSDPSARWVNALIAVDPRDAEAEPGDRSLG